MSLCIKKYRIRTFLCTLNLICFRYSTYCRALCNINSSLRLIQVNNTLKEQENPCQEDNET